MNAVDNRGFEVPQVGLPSLSFPQHSKRPASSRATTISAQNKTGKLYT